MSNGKTVKSLGTVNRCGVQALWKALFLLFLVSFFHKPHKTFPEKIQRIIRASLIFQNYNWEQQLLQEIQETETLNFYFLYGMKALICERSAITL